VALGALRLGAPFDTDVLVLVCVPAGMGGGAEGGGEEALAAEVLTRALSSLVVLDASLFGGGEGEGEEEGEGGEGGD